MNPTVQLLKLPELVACRVSGQNLRSSRAVRLASALHVGTSFPAQLVDTLRPLDASSPRSGDPLTSLAQRRWTGRPPQRGNTRITNDDNVLWSEFRGYVSMTPQLL